MPVTATKGVRGKFYRELAQQTRQVETLVVGPSTFGFGSVTVRSESSNPSKISSFPSPVARTKHYLPKKPQMAFSQHHEATEHPSRRDSGRSCDDDDDGWGSPPTPTRRKKSNSQSVSRNTLSRISVSDKMEDRAQLTKHDSLLQNNPATLSRPSEKITTRSIFHSRSPGSKAKVDTWIASSNRKHNDTALAPHSAQSHSQSRLGSSRGTRQGRRSPKGHSANPTPFASVQTKEGEEAESTQKMNYFQQQDLPSTSYRRYDPSSHPLHPPITDSYRAYTDQRPPGTGSLHPTNPFYGGASLSFPSGDPSAAARPNEAGTFAALEREKQAALARAQEMQHKIDEGRRSAAPFAHSHSYHRGEDTTQTILSLKQETTILNSIISSQRDQLSYTEHKVLDLEQRLTSQNKTFEAIMKERDQLDTLSTSLQGTLEEEKKRRSDLELQVESSKKGQSISAKQVKHLEEKLKEVEERDRALQEGKDRFEKRVKDLEEDKSQLKKQVEAATSKYNNAYREKEGIIVKLRGREHDNSKMSDKLNLMRRENQALQSVIEELKEDLHTLKEEIKKGSPDEYKRVKEELRRERSTSDRLRSERNELREGFQELRRSYERHLSLVSTLRFNSRLREREHESGNEAKQSRMGLQVQEAEYDKNRYKTELLEPKPTSADQHRPKFSLNANDYLKTDLNDDGSGGGGGGVVEVITDEDGLEYQGRHMKMDDEERPVEKNTSQRLSTSLQITNNGKAREEKEKEKESGALLAFTMDSIPLQPVKMDTPLSKEEISLFSPAPPTASVPELREGVRSKQAEEDSRKRWLEGYAQASGLKVKDERDHGDVKTQLDSSSRPTLKMLGNGEPAQINKDPFAELDPLL